MWGVWSNVEDGFVDGPFWDFDSAREAFSKTDGYEDELEVLEICPWHEDEPRHYCVKC